MTTPDNDQLGLVGARILAALDGMTSALQDLAAAAQAQAHAQARLAALLAQVYPDAAKASQGPAAAAAAPNLRYDLASYANFDWASIGARVLNFDQHGATRVQHAGQIYKRYRSNDDDPKGADIRFRRVASGTPENKDMVWVTLVKFAQPRPGSDPRPLRGQLAATVEHAAASQAPRTDAPLVLAQPKTRADVEAAINASNDDYGRGWATNQAPADPPAAPDPADALRDLLLANAQLWGAGRVPSPGTRQSVFLALKAAAAGNDATLHAVILWVFGASSFKGLDAGAIWALQSWLKPTSSGPANSQAQDQVNAILARVGAQAAG